MAFRYLTRTHYFICHIIWLSSNVYGVTTDGLFNHKTNIINGIELKTGNESISRNHTL